MVALIDWLAKLPVGCCWVCQQRLAIGEHGGFCQPCLRDLPRLPPSCLRWRCQQPELAVGRHWFAALSWQPEVAALVHRFKFHGASELAPILAPLLAAQIQHCYRQRPQQWPDLLVAMPISHSRWFKRGYNQAALLARQLQPLLQLPFAPGLLRRLPQQAKQQHRSGASERWHNMANSMHCTRAVDGLTIALVDDVLTTGASVSAAAEALLRRGAKAVDAWTLAYSEPHQPRDVAD